MSQEIKGTIFNPEKIAEPSKVVSGKGKKPFNDLYLPMLTPTRDNTMDDQLTLNCISIAQMLKKEYIRVTATASTIHAARSEAFRLLKKSIKEQLGYDVSNVRGMLVDSDIRWDGSENSRIVEEMKKADEGKYNFVLPYRIRDEVSILSKTVNTNPQAYHRIPIMQYLTEWENYKDADVAGLGFYYGDLPLDYVFHFTDYGEDMNFFLDNNIKPKVVNSINIFHVKKMLLGLRDVRYL
jgi:hypothetical protein